MICPHCGLAIEEPVITQIPDQLKNDNWDLFKAAKGSNNPEVMIPYTQKLVNHLMMTVKLANNTEYDDMLKWCWGAANWSMEKLSEIMDRENPNKDWSVPVKKCEYILSQVGIMIYDPKKRWAITQPGGFRVYPGVATTPSSAGKQEVKVQ